jgi:hypothetical protein
MNEVASSVKYTCKFCKKSFSKETTLISHVCEKKRRAQQEKEVGVQLGLQAYLMFYQSTQSGTKSKTYQDFAESPYYTAFIKFGRYCVSIRCINFSSFTRWLLQNNKKLDFWCSDKLYEEWMAEYLKRESAQDALERAIKEITEYAEDHPELKNGFRDYFRYANGNRICHHICSGRISPWVVFNCASGVEFVEGLPANQVDLLLPWIDPAYWNGFFKDNPKDVQWVRDILAAAGL